MSYCLKYVVMIICITNNKGGCSKTTTVYNLGAALALNHKKKVLLIDLDSQSNLTTTAGVTIEDDNHIGQLLLKKKTVNDVLVKDTNISPLVHLLPSSIKLRNDELTLAGLTSRETILKKALRDIKKNYDYILIDTPPSLNLLTTNGLFTSDYYLITLNAEPYSYLGIRNIIQFANEIYEDSECELGGLILTRYNDNQRGKLNRDLAQRIKESAIGKENLFSTYIRENIKLRESILSNKTVFEYAPGSPGAVDYTALANEFVVKF